MKFFIIRALQKSEVEAIVDPSARNWPRLIGLNGATGFTSFFLMGEAPIQMFLLPFRLAPQVYVSLLIWYFFLINIVKVPIAFGIGLVTIDSLWVSACLLPIMPLGNVHRKADQQTHSKRPVLRDHSRSAGDPRGVSGGQRVCPDGCCLRRARTKKKGAQRYCHVWTAPFMQGLI